jgi:hypothetical protein
LYTDWTAYDFRYRFSFIPQFPLIKNPKPQPVENREGCVTRTQSRNPKRGCEENR